jgi:hypothetical protein
MDSEIKQMCQQKITTVVLGCKGTMRASVSAAFNGSARRKDKDARKDLDLIRAKKSWSFSDVPQA